MRPSFASFFSPVVVAAVDVFEPMSRPTAMPPFETSFRGGAEFYRSEPENDPAVLGGLTAIGCLKWLGLIGSSRGLLDSGDFYSLSSGFFLGTIRELF